MYVDQQIFKRYIGTCKNHCKKTSIHKHLSVQTFPPRHVHFFRVCHTWIDFSGHNPEGEMQWVQGLCGNSTASGVQWRSNKTCWYPEQGSDTILNYWTIDHTCNESNWKVELCSGILRTIYTKKRQIWDKSDKNWSVNYNINLYSFQQ